MTGSFQSMSHSKWDCEYHIVFIPKRRRKAVFGNLRKHLGAIFHELARQKECTIIEGHLMPDHVHMCISIAPKYAVSSVIGFIKGKSAIAIARQFAGCERNFTGEHFWARGRLAFRRSAMKKRKCAPTSASKRVTMMRGVSSPDSKGVDCQRSTYMRPPAFEAVTFTKPPPLAGVSDFSMKVEKPISSENSLRFLTHHVI